MVVKYMGAVGSDKFTDPCLTPTQFGPAVIWRLCQLSFGPEKCVSQTTFIDKKMKGILNESIKWVMHNLANPHLITNTLRRSFNMENIQSRCKG